MIEINRCYLDNAATTKVCPEAVKAAVRAMEEIYGNPSSLHRLGLEAENVMSDARRVIAGILDAQPGEILFTSGATESDNLALLGTAAAYRRTGNRIVSSAVEHPAVSACLDRLEEQGFEVVRIKPRENGEVCAQDFADAVNQKTWMVSCMQVNNETGLIFPIEQIARQVKAKNPKTLVHIDAAQGFCKLSLSVKKVPVDLISVSGHKIHAPKGIGALYLRKGTRLVPQLLGGGQEGGLRSGTEPVPLIAALGAAAKRANQSRAEVWTHFERLYHYLVDRLVQLPGVSLHLAEGQAPYIVNFSVPGIRSEIMLHHLEQLGIYVSSGSACSKGARSSVLAALGLPNSQIDSAIRVSMSGQTTLSELDRLLQGVRQGIDTLSR